MIIHNFEQGTPEWFACRAGKMTGSNAETIQACGKGLETYIHEVLAQKYAHTQEVGYTNEHMERGKTLEADARTLFELQHSKKVTEVGFVEYDEYVGASPDGLIEEENAIIEIKCHANLKHFRLMVYGQQEIEKKYLWQMQMEMLCAKSAWGYYIAYNPNFEESLLVFKIDADPTMWQKLYAGFAKGKEYISTIENTLLYGKN
jgi:putative phage-type endonuclease